MKMKIEEKKLKKIVSESIKKNLIENNTSFDPYNYSFEAMDDDDFNSFYDDEDEADMHKELIDLASDGANVFRRMKEVIETSNYYNKDTNNKVIKKYLEKINNITDIIETFWD